MVAQDLQDVCALDRMGRRRDIRLAECNSGGGLTLARCHPPSAIRHRGPSRGTEGNPPRGQYGGSGNFTSNGSAD